MVRPWSAGERITHSSIGDRCTNDNSKRHTSAAYLPFRWHQRDPAKEKRVAAAPLRRGLMNWTSLPSRARSEWALCCGSVSGRGAKRDQKNDSFGSTSFFSPKTKNQWNVCLSMNIYSIYRGSLYTYKSFFWHDRLAVAAYQLRSICGISVGSDLSLWRKLLDLAKISLRANKRERSKQSRSFARSKTSKRSCRISGSFPRPTKIQQSRPTLIQKKGEEFGNKQTAFYHTSKGSKP